MFLLHVDYARSVRFSEPPKIKDVAVHPYFEIKFKNFFIENHSFIPKD